MVINNLFGGSFNLRRSAPKVLSPDAPDNPWVYASTVSNFIIRKNEENPETQKNKKKEIRKNNVQIVLE